MNIYICSLLSKKNLKFLNSYLKSLNKLKIPGNCKLQNHICFESKNLMSEKIY